MSHWLTGRRIIVTRAESQAEELLDRLRALGAEPIPFPVIAFVPPEATGPLDQAIAQLDSYDWVIFTSVNGVEHFWARLPKTEVNRPIWGRVAAVGPATAKALRQHGASIHLIPSKYRAQAILDEIGDVTGQRILLPSADIAHPTLAQGLRAMGAQVEQVIVYRTVLGEPSPAALDTLRSGVDAVIFTSSSSVRNFLTLTADLDYGDPLIACIGPVTAATAQELDLRVDLIPEKYTIDGLLDALKRIT